MECLMPEIVLNILACAPFNRLRSDAFNQMALILYNNFGIIVALKSSTFRSNDIEVCPHSCFSRLNSAKLMPILLASSVPIRPSALIVVPKYDSESDGVIH